MTSTLETKVSVFETLNNLDLSKKTKEKNDLTYTPWAAAWAEVKKVYPDATFCVTPQTMDGYGNTRFWHDDGKSGWVEVSVTIQDETQTETLAIMDYRNNSIPAEKITSTDANKSVKRCLVKALALHGLGIYVYMGEDLPEELKMANALRSEIKDLIDKKVKLSDFAKEKVIELCKNAEKEANPNMEDDLIRGNPKNIDDIDILTELKQKLLNIRK